VVALHQRLKIYQYSKELPVTSKYIVYFSVVILTGLLSFGCVQHTQEITQQENAAETTLKKVYKGKITNKSNRKQRISLDVIEYGNTSSIEIYFDDLTRGIDHAVKGKQVAISCTLRNKQPYARVIRPEITTLAPGIKEITVKDVKKMIDAETEYLLFDSRPEEEYVRSHLPTAISLPVCTMEENIDELPEENRNILLIFYCGSPTCGMSSPASATAARAGYRNIRVMLAGEEGWIKSGYPTYADDDFVRRADRILIDLRATRNDAVERIPGSVSIPLDTLEDRLDDIPKKAPVIVYSDKIRDSLAALSELKEAEFRKISMVEGNFRGWKKRNKPVISGPVETRIHWTRKLGKGEVSLAVFQKAMKGKINAVILDVRTDEEVAAGKLGRAQHIPLNSLAKRREELPVNKKIFIYSATGARADMAREQLNENGYDAYFLMAEVTCKGGSCSIEY